MGRELSPDEVDRVTAAIYAGRRIEAIRLYRVASGDDLSAAVQVVEGIEARLRAESPEKFAAVSRSALGGIVFAVVSLAMAVGLVALVRPGMFGGANQPAPPEAKPLRAAQPAEGPPVPVQAERNAAQKNPLANAQVKKFPSKLAPRPARGIPKLPKLVDTSVDEAAPYDGELAGAWLLHFTAGKERPVKFSRVDATHFRLESGVVFNGLYEVLGGRLVMEKSIDPRSAGFEWSIRDGDHLRLIVQPAVNLAGGQNYLGATLTRQDDAN
jgi:hypothetical protein